MKTQAQVQMDVEIKQQEEVRRFLQFIELKNINDNVIKKYQFSPTTEKYDVSMVSGDTVMITEIKVRADKNIAFFEKYGPFLELKKLEGMQQRTQEINFLYSHLFPNLKKYYFNFCSDGIMIYELKNPCDYIFELRKLPKDNTNSHILVDKMVHSLKNPVEIIRYKN